MEDITKLFLLPFATLTLFSSVRFKDVKNDFINASAASNALPTTIKLAATSEDNIRSYYSSLASSKDTNYGTTLLGKLKSVIKSNHSYYSYSDVTQIYKITDRYWDKSSASEIPGYDASTETITDYSYDNDNPYVFQYYVDRDYQKINPIRFKETGAESVSFDKEHIWSQSHGFPGPTQYAGTDLHHLVCADPEVNRHGHNNLSYGNVKVNNYTPASQLTGNKRGTPVHTDSRDEENTVFEPQDSDKGDFARALLYMVARYNYFDDHLTPSVEEPNLTLVNYIIKNSCDLSTIDSPAPYGIISDLLEWNKLDPVDDYEIKRNDLIYENYQHTRNPFIDFPSWVDCIWNSDGTYVTSKPDKCADPSKDTVHSNTEYELSSLSIDPSSTMKTSYNLDEKLDTNGLVLSATFYEKENPSKTVVKQLRNGFDVSNVDTSTPGNKTVLVTYDGKTTQYNINVSNYRWTPSTVETSAKYKVESYNNVSSTNPPSGSSASFYNTTKIAGTISGGNNATLTLSKFPQARIKGVKLEMKTIKSNIDCVGSFEMKSGNDVLASISSLPFNQWYDVPETPSTDTWNTVTVTLLEPYNIIIPSQDITLKISADENSIHINSFEIIYEKGELENQATVDHIAINAEPSKTSYLLNEKLNLSGLAVTAYYTDGSSQLVTDYTSSIPDQTPLTEVGEKEITITYKNKTASFKIMVSAPLPTKLMVTAKPNKTSYIVGEELDLTGLKIQVQLEDGQIQDTTDYQTSIQDKTKLTEVGEKEVFVTYKNNPSLTTSFKIEVKNKEEQKSNNLTYIIIGAASVGIIVLGTLITVLTNNKKHRRKKK